MKKLMKILTKTLYTVVCFLLLPYLSISINEITSSAHERPIPTRPSAGYVSLHTDYLGQKVKRSEVSELEVTVGVRNDKINSGGDLEISFYAGIYTFEAMRVASSDENEETYYYGKNSKELLEPGVYVYGPLFHYCNFFAKKYRQYSKPSTVDAFGEEAYLLHFKVDLMDDRLDKISFYSSKCMVIEATLTVGYDLDFEKQFYSYNSIYYAVDGDYIAFSDKSYEDAKRILLGDSGYYWKVTVPEFFSDLFAGCSPNPNRDDDF